MLSPRVRGLFLMVMAVASAGCAAKRPVLYPNARFEQVGQAAAEADIEDCMARAKGAGMEASQGRKAAERAAGGAAAGGATGAVVGAISGSAGRGAAAGAAGGATAGLFYWFFGSRNRDVNFQLYVEQCLVDKGFQPIGWR